MTEVMDEPEVDVAFTPDDEYEDADPAHIIFPWVEVGEKALTLCGKKHKVEMDWPEIPSDYPICRGCVNRAVVMLSDAVRQTTEFTVLTGDVVAATRALVESVDTESVLFDTVASALVYQDEREEKALAKAVKKAAKKKAKKEKKEKPETKPVEDIDETNGEDADDEIVETEEPETKPVEPEEQPDEGKEEEKPRKFKKAPKKKDQKED